MIQLPTTPNSDENSKWVAPPMIGNSEAQSYLFKLRPDCAYWLSLQAFSENHRDGQESSVHRDESDHLSLFHDRIQED
jgi:hypothetical protein